MYHISINSSNQNFEREISHDVEMKRRERFNEFMITFEFYGVLDDINWTKLARYNDIQFDYFVSITMR